MPLLSVDHLSTGFPIGGRWVPAVQDVSFSLEAAKPWPSWASQAAASR